MPGKNLIRSYAPQSYYHIYNRGVNKQEIFRDKEDYAVFLSLVKRYLGDKIVKRSNGTPNLNFYDDISLLAFCLMSNHFHFMVYQGDNERAITEFIRSLITSYGMYFNKKYNRVGALFQQRYRAVLIGDDSYLLHISRYIHLNPKDYMNYEWSSLPYYLGYKQASWVKPGQVLELFDDNYISFVRDYKSTKDEIDTYKHLLADN